MAAAAEIRVTIEVLDARGTIINEAVVLSDPDEPGLMGDIETALDGLLEDEEDGGGT